MWQRIPLVSLDNQMHAFVHYRVLVLGPNKSVGMLFGLVRQKDVTLMRNQRSSGMNQPRHFSKANRVLSRACTATLLLSLMIPSGAAFADGLIKFDVVNAKTGKALSGAVIRIEPAASYLIVAGSQLATATITAEGINVTKWSPTRPGWSQGEVQNHNAFAVLKNDGSVVAWGDSAYGGTAPAGLGNVTQIF